MDVYLCLQRSDPMRSTLLKVHTIHTSEKQWKVCYNLLLSIDGCCLLVLGTATFNHEWKWIFLYQNFNFSNHFSNIPNTIYTVLRTKSPIQWNGSVNYNWYLSSRKISQFWCCWFSLSSGWLFFSTHIFENHKTLTWLIKYSLILLLFNDMITYLFWLMSSK